MLGPLRRASAVERGDDVTAIPPQTHTTVSLIDAHHERTPDPPRPHMGVSNLGHSCDRWLWLSFRWAVREQLSGRMRRLFRRGLNEEATVLADLRAIGCVIRETPGGQLRVDFGSHVSGSLDGVIESGVPEAPKTPHVLEVKTMSKKNFDLLEKHGLKEANKKHFVQMQCYMHGTGLDRALYIAVCKDDDRMYAERVPYEADVAEKAIARGKRLAIQDEQPPPLSTDATWYECKICAAHSWCHNGVGITEKNCRICAYSTALPDSTWRCEKHNADGIPLDFQRRGCADFDIHDHLLPF
jgi:hypothetical protein